MADDKAPPYGEGVLRWLQEQSVTNARRISEAHAAAAKSLAPMAAEMLGRDRWDAEARAALFWTRESYLTPMQAAQVERVAAALRAAARHGAEERDAELDAVRADLATLREAADGGLSRLESYVRAWERSARDYGPTGDEVRTLRRMLAEARAALEATKPREG